MKKMITLLAFTLISLSANATLSVVCKKQMNEVINNHVLIQELLSSGVISSERAISHETFNQKVAESVALMCSGLNEVEEESKETYQEAMEYYLNSVK